MQIFTIKSEPPSKVFLFSFLKHLYWARAHTFTVYSVKVYNAMVFSIFTDVSNYHHSKVLSP